LKTDFQKYYLILLTTVLMVVGARNILKNPCRTIIVAIRDSDIAARGESSESGRLQDPGLRRKRLLSGIAGGLFGFRPGVLRPLPTFNLILSIIFLVMVVVAGWATITGSYHGRHADHLPAV